MDFALAGRMLGAFAVIALVLFALQFVARTGLRQQLSSGGSRRLVTVLDTTFLPNAASLHVVKVADKYVLIGRSGGHIATLSEIPPEKVDAWLSSQPASPLEATALAGMIARWRGSA
ncbi:MAG: flagellar biosynthetic protein FliO [Vulcanimicrobiaceae bacterium]